MKLEVDEPKLKEELNNELTKKNHNNIKQEIIDLNILVNDIQSGEQKVDKLIELKNKIKPLKSIKGNKRSTQTTLLNHFKLQPKEKEQKKIKIEKLIINKIAKEVVGLPHEITYHYIDEKNIQLFRTELLSWYDQHQRALPWRTKFQNEQTLEQRNLQAYKVWVSEIMLQQTQVETVKSYFIKWIKLFPTIQVLAKATIEEVNQAWAGLGYYQRAKRLFEGAKLVIEKLDGKIPDNFEELLKLPGVGPYTAGAIASIAFNQPNETVDGNIMRILTRILAISGDIRSSNIVSLLWSKAKELLDRDRPGDFNQAYMDLGSLVCTVNNPNCKACPFSGVENGVPICKAFLESQVKLIDIENADLMVSHKESCLYCIELNNENHLKQFPVTRYPFKSPNKKKRDQECVVLVIKNNKENGEYLITKRSEKGLLAGMWEFPNYELLLEVEPKAPSKKIQSSKVAQSKVTQFRKSTKYPHLKEVGFILERYLKTKDIEILFPKIKYNGPVLHVFSHINQIYHVYSVSLEKGLTIQTDGSNMQWVMDPRSHSLPTAFTKVWEKTTFFNL